TPLEDVGASLRDVFMRVSVEIEVPGLRLLQLGECSGGLLHGGQQQRPAVYIQQFGAAYSSVTRSHYTLKRIQFIGSNGCSYCFLVQPYTTAHQRTEQRLLCLLLQLNRLLLRHNPSRRRGLAFPLSAQVSIH